MPPLALASPSPRFGSRRASTACTLASESGATATAHWAMIRIFSGAAVAATSTIVATWDGPASLAVIAALTISQAQSWLAATWASTISRSLSGWALISSCTATPIFRQSTGSAVSGRVATPRPATTNARFSVCFMERLRWGEWFPVCAERATGIEPVCPAWKAGALPLSYARWLIAGYIPRERGRKPFSNFFFTPRTAPPGGQVALAGRRSGRGGFPRNSRGFRLPSGAGSAMACPRPQPRRGCSSMVERELPKLDTWVRFPSPVPAPLTARPPGG